MKRTAVQGPETRQLLLVAITLSALAPFANKAFHIDDPLFVWIAQQIVKYPFDPYDFNVNWSGFGQPMADVMQNPPLCSYYIAAVGAIFGWSEPALHFAFLLWPVLAVIGTFAFARRLCHEPFLAALLTIFMPVFFVSATSVMCDVMMLALWIWAIEFWLAALDRQSSWRFFVSALLISAAMLTKYFAVALVPLLVVYTIVRDRRLTRNLVFLLIPIAVLSNYDFLTEQKYGHALFTAATTMSAAILSITRPSHAAQLLIGLSFCGGCFFSTLFFFPFTRSRKALKAGLLAAVVLVGLAIAFKFSILSWIYTESSEWPISLEAGIFATSGVGILALAAIHFCDQKSPNALLLLLWIFGTFLFGTFLNWSVTSRTFLPMAPAVAILMFRHFGRQQTAAKGLSILAAGALSILLAVADYREANCSRLMAGLFRERFGGEPNKVWFQEHWGFQYYMQLWGASPFDQRNPELNAGAVFVGPFRDVGMIQISPERVSSRQYWTCEALPCLGISALGSGASFYTSFAGPAPWIINKIAPRRFYAIRLQ